jgi:hypothetical protein
VEGNAGDTGFEGPASRLVGRELDNGWSVTERLNRSVNGSWGTYSVGYLVEDDDGRRAYMKAHDYARVIRETPNFSQVMSDMLRSFLFEEELNRRCVRRRMDRVVKTLDSGSIPVEGSDIPVNYLIFELAEGDIRDRLNDPAGNDLAWKLTTAHQVAVGLWQLHRAGVHHRNLRPSTLMDFGKQGSKVGGLAGASHDGETAPLTAHFIGDPDYAPPEFLFEYEMPEKNMRLKARDLYMFGSVILFLFGGYNATCGMLSKLPLCHLPGASSASFEQVLPHLIEATDKVAEEFAASLEPYGLEEIADRYVELCDPDPRHRGHPRSRGMHSDPYSLERYVSFFDHLSAKFGPGLVQG